MDTLRIVVAGHVDHGKSTLIGRLLYDTGSLPRQMADRFDDAGGSAGAAAFAFVTDQLSEEQQGSFTLDTAQAHFRTKARDCILIDTPGHREFLKNMVTGTSGADAAILVVDAEEGPLPQTYLHAYLIVMLGIRQVIVAINKMDRISYDRHRFHLLSQHLAAHLEKAGIAPRAVIPVSAQEGDHIVARSNRMPWSASPPLLEALDALTPRERGGVQPLRFLVQCPFTTNGQRAVLGRVTCGAVRRGQTVVFGPVGHRTVVTSVLVGQQEVHEARAGQCAGLLLQDPAPVKRGHVGFAAENAPWITDQWSARVFWIGRRSLEVKGKVEILCGTQSCPAHVEKIARVIDPISLATVETDAVRLDDSRVAAIAIRTDALLCVDPFDDVPELGRFAVLQDGRIAGGGVIAR